MILGTTVALACGGDSGSSESSTDGSTTATATRGSTSAGVGGSSGGAASSSGGSSSGGEGSSTGDPLPPATFDWYTADAHIHGYGCAGMLDAAGLVGLLKDADIDIGDALVWGGCSERAGCSYDVDSANLIGQHDDPASDAETILRWDVEISALPGASHSHQVLLNIADPTVVQPGPVVNYPGTAYLLPNYEWAHAQGGLAGLGHAGNWPEGSYSVNPVGITPRSLPMDAALEDVDFLKTEHVGSPNFRSIYYRMLDHGFQIPVIGGSDYPCAFLVGATHTVFAVPRNQPLSFDGWVDAIKRHQTFARRRSDPLYFTDFRVDGAQMGSQLELPAGTTVEVEVDAQGENGAQLEVVVNGEVEQTSPITDTLETYTFDVDIAQSSWILVRTEFTESSATFVVLDGQPIRNDPDGACQWKAYLDLYYDYALPMMPAASQAAFLADINAARQVWHDIALDSGLMCP